MSLDYRLVRSARRRTLSIQVRDGEVIVRAPSGASQRAIDRFLQHKRDWIEQHRHQQQRDLDQLGVRLQPGGCVPWQGQMLTLDWQRGTTSAVELHGQRLQLTLSARIRRDEIDAVRRHLQHWYRAQAECQLPQRTWQLAEQTGLRPARVGIGSWRSRWGQCSQAGEVLLNWRLLQLRPALQDYVILHELCHLRHLDHGPGFQRLLAQHCAAHPQWRREMRRYSHWLRW